MRGRMLLMLSGLTLLATPAWAPSAPRVDHSIQWEDAQLFAQQYRARLRKDSVRLPDSLAFQIVLAADRNKVERHLAFQMVWAESRFLTSARGKAGDVGLVQILPRTAFHVCGVKTSKALFEPATNLDCGFRYFAQLVDRYDGLTWFALTAYNRGPYMADRIKAEGLGYPERVLGN